DEATCSFPECYPVDVGGRVILRESTYLPVQPLGTSPPHDMATIRKWLKVRRVHMIEIEPMLSKFQVINDLAVKHVANVSAVRYAEPREYLFCRDRTADTGQSFYHQNFQTLCRQIAGGDHAIVTCANNDGVVFRIGHYLLPPKTTAVRPRSHSGHHDS